MNGKRIVWAMVIGVVTLLAACEKESATPAAPPISQTASEAATTAPSEASTSAATPAAAAAPAATQPEDLVVDEALEAPIRAKAKELGAIRPVDLTHRKAGETVAVLVRARLNDGGVYGSGPYTLDSTIRRTSIHAGLLRDGELGLLRAEIFVHDGDHTSDERNGVRPNKWGKYHASYTLEKVDLAATTQP